MTRLAVVAPHPVQYQAPLFRKLAASPSIDLQVFYASDWGVRPSLDPGFSRAVAWNVPLLEGYDYEFLRNYGVPPGPEHFFGLLNPGIWNRLRRGRFDAVLIQGWAFATNWLALAAARRVRVPVLFRAETVAQARDVRRSLRNTVARAMVSRCHACLYIGTRSQRFYQAQGVPASRLHFTPYAVDNERFFAAAEAARGKKLETLAAAGFDTGRPLALFAGKLVARKRPGDAIEAMGRLRGTGQLAVVGDGPLRPSLEARVRAKGWNHIRFLGFQDQQAIARWYAAADLFLMPSAYEPWGLVVNEAMCFGLPVLTTTGVAAADDLVSVQNGAVLPIGDVDALSERAREVLEDSRLRAKMGRKSRERIENWGLDASIRGFESALAEVSAA